MTTTELDRWAAADLREAKTELQKVNEEIAALEAPVLRLAELKTKQLKLHAAIVRAERGGSI